MWPKVQGLGTGWLSEEGQGNWGQAAWELRDWGQAAVRGLGEFSVGRTMGRAFGDRLLLLVRDRLLQAGPAAAWGGNGIVGYGLERMRLWFRLWP